MNKPYSITYFSHTANTVTFQYTCPDNPAEQWEWWALYKGSVPEYKDLEKYLTWGWICPEKKGCKSSGIKTVDVGNLTIGETYSLALFKWRWEVVGFEGFTVETPFNLRRQVLWLSGVCDSLLSQDIETDAGISEQLQQKIQTKLNQVFANSQLKELVGQWDMLWGPIIYQSQISQQHKCDHLMYVVQKPNTTQCIITIAGKSSDYRWFSENFEDWATCLKSLSMNQGSIPKDIDDIYIYKGASIGLNILMNQMTYEGQTLLSWLQSYTEKSPQKEMEIIVTGHEHGGVLSASLALALVELQQQWNHQGNAKVFALSTGGVTAGNRKFAERYHEKLEIPSLKKLPKEPLQTQLKELPSQLQAKYYSYEPSQPKEEQFPELKIPRYNPQSYPFGVCFSGGGTRSLSACIGQMRALKELGLLDNAVGAISGVSGGSWFSVMASYAPEDIDDSTLLGPVIPPNQLTPENTKAMDEFFMGLPVTKMTGKKALPLLEDDEKLDKSEGRSIHYVYSQLLNSLLLKKFNLDKPKFFSLDENSVKQITDRNPGLSSDDFYTMRSNRPYLYVGTCLVYQEDDFWQYLNRHLGNPLVLKRFEYNPLYVGMPQNYQGDKLHDCQVGGGFLETFAFGSLEPNTSNNAEENTVTVPTPKYPFTLSDAMASSGAAPGYWNPILDAYPWIYPWLPYIYPLLPSSVKSWLNVDPSDLPSSLEVFPKFNYWPIFNIGKEQAKPYRFLDGAGLENTGIIPLLFRQYPVILVFSNTSIKIDHQDKNGQPDTVNAVDGISEDIARLFGHKGDLPTFCDLGNWLGKAELDLDIQIFPKEKFQALAEGLKQKKANKEPIYFKDTYTIKPDNPFGIPSYEVTVVWFYLEQNEEWEDKLPKNIQQKLPDDFPNYSNAAQDSASDKQHKVIPFLDLSPEEVNLLAHMTCQTVLDAKDTLEELKNQFKR
ncbi:MAG: hypothetical protein F6K16_20645 [Symploca sp. SIO2B6]|nr:hypothetical protein [Symploca sp. SIO2B6]